MSPHASCPHAPRGRAYLTLLVAGLAACGAPASTPDDGAPVPPGADAGAEPPAPVADAGAPPDGGPPLPVAPVVYPLDRRHSPISVAVVARLRAIAQAAPRTDAVFAKIGDSMTRAPEFLRCFDGGPVDLGGRVALAPTVAHYMTGDALGRTPYRRDSVAAFGGATTDLLLAGAPAPLDAELGAIAPRLGVIMIGTNDVRDGRPLEAFARELWQIVDRQIDQGTIPVLSTIPSNPSDAWAEAQIPRWNLAIRGIAQGRQVPLVDLHRALGALPGRGIGPDGVHLSADPAGACLLTAEGLAHGFNMRNLVTLEALTRVRAALAGTASDDVVATRAGAGTSGDPYRPGWPFADLGDIRGGEALALTHGCGGRDQPGAERVYELDLPAQVRLHAQVVAPAGVDVDVHVLAGGTCRGSGDGSVIATVGPGRVRVVVDTPVGAAEGEYLLLVAPRANTPG